jgi:hypothetical protein
MNIPKLTFFLLLLLNPEGAALTFGSAIRYNLEEDRIPTGFES